MHALISYSASHGSDSKRIHSSNLGEARQRGPGNVVLDNIFNLLENFQCFADCVFAGFNLNCPEGSLSE
ncbi:hypothetical protein B566_EDAN012283 [Ephemera danica]|nr:hypothetical protein B566_EDAN012283 [Ephemera danica]